MNQKRHLWITGAMIFSLLFFSGCFLFLLGVGAAGGYAISKDTIEGLVGKSYDRVWNAGRDVIMSEGFIRSEDKNHGALEAEVRKVQVNIEVKQMTERTVRIQVKARKGYKLLPDINLANELYNKIYAKVK